jgi:hypothetical protein
MYCCLLGSKKKRKAPVPIRTYPTVMDRIMCVGGIIFPDPLAILGLNSSVFSLVCIYDIPLTYAPEENSSADGKPSSPQEGGAVSVHANLDQLKSRYDQQPVS